MAKTKILLLLSVLILAASTASGLFYRVEVDQSLNHSTFNMDFNESITDVQTVSVAVNNIGSVGCNFRLRTVQEGQNFSSIDYSRSYPMWPGSSSLMQVKFIPLNYTGGVNSTLFLDYCGKSDKITSFSFKDTTNTTLNNSIESETIRATDEEVEIKLPVKNGYLVPVQTPPYWRVGSTTINNGKAVSSYTPPIFERGETLRYAVVNETTGDAVGTTKVSLNPEKTLIEEAEDNVLEILLGVSVLLNAVFVGERIKRYRK